jgi:hypothetical protein
MSRTANTAPLSVVPVQSVVKGEFVRLVKPCGCAAPVFAGFTCPCCLGTGYVPSNSKTYVRADYCRFTKKFALDDHGDINNQRLVKRGTLVLIGFTY